MEASPTISAGQSFIGQIKINYDDDPDRERAGQGLQLFPLAYSALSARNLESWEMAPGEQAALVFLLQNLRPKVAIEIGTRFGGSLQVLAQFCERVYSIDIDPEVPKRLAGRFPNVEYMIGSSKSLLPPLLDRLQKEGAELSFALVDGDHTTEGVRSDIDNLLRFRPTVPLYVIMHDSFNPNCRRGLKEARWADSPYVHAVELDFVAGTVNRAPAFRNQLWGGFALGILLPEKRTGRFEITARSEATHQTALAAYRGTLLERAIGKARRMLSI
jgi:hypothetical protein